VDNKDLGDIILIDFDWSGEENAVRYPSNITLINTELPRPNGVECGGLICPAHDDEMLDAFLSDIVSLIYFDPQPILSLTPIQIPFIWS